MSSNTLAIDRDLVSSLEAFEMASTCDFVRVYCRLCLTNIKMFPLEILSDSQ